MKTTLKLKLLGITIQSQTSYKLWNITVDVGTPLGTRPSKIKTIRWLLKESNDGSLKRLERELLLPETERLFLAQWQPAICSHKSVCQKNMAHLLSFLWVWHTDRRCPQTRSQSQACQVTLLTDWIPLHVFEAHISSRMKRRKREKTKCLQIRRDCREARNAYY